MSNRHEDPGQGDMIAAAPQGDGQFQVRDFSVEDPVVNRIEQKLDLMNCIGQIAAVSMRDGLIRWGEEGIRDRYADRAESIINGARQERAKFAADAKQSFARATGHFALIETGYAPEAEVQDVTRGMFSGFLKQYYGPRHYKEAQAFVRTLGKDVRELRDLDLTVSQHNREHQLRPHQAKPAAKVDDKSERRKLPEIDTRSRLQAIALDPRAAFLPITNREKNTVMSFLDYFDNPKYPLGISNQLLEVMVHQQKDRTYHEAIRAAESIAWEIGDYLADAAKGHRLLGELRTAMQDVSPRVTMAEEFGEDAEALPYLLRFEAVQRFMKTGKTNGLRDPLLTKEDRQVKGGSDPGKHKTVHSHFTAPNRPAATDEYITQRAQNMSVRTARKLIDDAIQNELGRTRLMTRCLSDIGVALLTTYRVSQPIRDALQASWKAVEDEPTVQLIRHELFDQAA